MKTLRSIGQRIPWASAMAVGVVFVAAWATACGGAGGGGSAAPSPAPVVYTEADDAAKVEANVGDVFTVTLKENPTTGYSWDMKAGAGLSLVDDEFVPPGPSPSPLVGAGGTHTWRYKVDAAGTLTLRGAYVRPWEAEGKSAAEFSLTIEAQGQ